MEHPGIYLLTAKGSVPLRSTDIHKTILVNMERPKAETYEAINTLICWPSPFYVAAREPSAQE